MILKVDTSKFKMKPYEHQLKGVTTLLSHPVYGLYWKMRLGKTKAIIDTAGVLFENGLIDTVLICAPAQVKDVWLDPSFGEIATHNWCKGAGVYEFKEYDGLFVPHGQPCYLASSVEFLRQQGPRNNFPFVDNLLAGLGGRRIWFVFDEGSVLGNWNSLQTRAMIELRKAAAIKRVTLLDGTPRGNSHLSFYSKFKLLDPNILGCKTFFHFRARYSETTKVAHKWIVDEHGNRQVVASHVEVIAEKNMEDFTRRTAPYCEYLEQGPDMPTKVPGVLPVALSEKAWRIYCQMRDEMVAEIDTGICTAQQAAVKVIRLAQICAGFLGGVQEFGQTLFGQGESIEYMPAPITTEVHDIPTKAMMGWLEKRFDERPDFKCLLWSRFVPEIERLVKRLQTARGDTLPHFALSIMYGKVKVDDDILHPRHPYQGAILGVMQPQAVRYGKNYSKADTAVYLSQDYDRITRSQSEDRIQAKDKGGTSLLVDCLVTGPRGQKTVVHDIVASVRAKEDAERRTARDWRKVLTQE